MISGTPAELGRLVGRLLCGYDRLVSGTAELAMLEEGSSMVLETKYYKATVAVEYGASGHAGGDESPVGAHLAVLSSAAANETNSLPESESTDESIPVRLLVVVRQASDPELSDEARYACAVWALEHSCEFVYVDATADLVSTWNEREKDGLPRVVEALQSNMWSSMQRKESKDDQLKGAAPPKVVLSSAANPALPAAPEQKPSSENLSVADILSSAGCPAAEEVSQEERMLESFAGLVADARRQREEVLAGNVSDQLRRDRAAAFAMQFSKMLDGDDNEDDDESGSDSQG